MLFNRLLCSVSFHRLINPWSRRDNGLCGAGGGALTVSRILCWSSTGRVQMARRVSISLFIVSYYVFYRILCTCGTCFWYTSIIIFEFSWNVNFVVAGKTLFDLFNYFLDKVWSRLCFLGVPCFPWSAHLYARAYLNIRCFCFYTCSVQGVSFGVEAPYYSLRFNTLSSNTFLVEGLF